MKLALDHHYTRAIAEQLRSRGHDAVAAIERGWDREEDEQLLAICASEQRALVTNNVADFTAIVRRWAIQGRTHAGLIFTSDASLPRTRGTIGAYVKLLDDLLSQHPGPDAFTDLVHWL
jgi:predicted nuclease of predicted toxin-antitoxin system